MRLPNKLRLPRNIQLPITIPMVTATNNQVLRVQVRAVSRRIRRIGVVAPVQPRVVVPVDEREPVRGEVVPTVRIPETVDVWGGRDRVVLTRGKGQGAHFLRVGTCHDA